MWKHQVCGPLIAVPMSIISNKRSMPFKVLVKWQPFIHQRHNGVPSCVAVHNLAICNSGMLIMIMYVNCNFTPSGPVLVTLRLLEVGKNQRLNSMLVTKALAVLKSIMIIIKSYACDWLLIIGILCNLKLCIFVRQRQHRAHP